MRCPDCGAEYGAIICPPCSERKSREAYLSLQQVWLDRVLNGQVWLVLNRRTRSGPHHVVLFGDPMHAYCGTLLDGPQQRRKEAYSDKLRPDLCHKCVEVFDELVRKEAALKAEAAR